MNPGLAMFKKRQRLQGGSSKVNPDPEEGQTMRALPIGFKVPPDPPIVDSPRHIKKQTSDEEYDRQLDADFERNLRKRRFKPKEGPQFNPRDVPTFYDIDSGQIIFDPKYSSSADPTYAQGGTEEVPPWLKSGYEPQEPGTVWTSPSGVKKTASAKDASGLYAPQEMSEEELAKLEDERNAMIEARHNAEISNQQPGDWKSDSYKTVGIEINGKEIEIPQWGGQTIGEAEDMARMRLEWDLDPFATDEELEAVQNAAHQGPDDATMDTKSPNYTGRPGYAGGTSDLPDNEEDLPPWLLKQFQDEYNRKQLTPQQDLEREQRQNDELRRKWQQNPERYLLVQKGTSNVGLGIFRKAQRLQEGTSGLNYDPSYPGPTNPKESGSGYWTQKGVGTGVGIASNFIFPGLGLLTGPLASWAMRAMQSGMAQNAVQQAVQGYQQQAQQASDRGEAAPAVSDDSMGVSSDRSHHAGVGIDPEGNPADPGEWWSNDFGRWNTDKEGGFPGELGGNTQGGPGLSYGHFGTGFGSGTVGNFGTAIGWGNFGPGGGGSMNMADAMMGGHWGGMSSPMARAALAQYGSGYQFANPGAFGAFTQSSPQEQRHFLPRQNQQKGTSNVGLNLFRRKQMLKNKKP